MSFYSVVVLSKADLVHANLVRVNLSDVNLSNANLKHANLQSSNLERANLSHAILVGAGLIEANLTGANIRNADFSNADLTNACLSWANLNETILSGANLRGADLRGVKLAFSKLVLVELENANLEGAHLGYANLTGAKLKNANLKDTDLTGCNLAGANLTRAKLTGAKLYASARDDWIIKKVKCRYVYWDAKGKQRSPNDRDLKPGEFERLYAALPSIEYIFEQGMSPIDPLIMDRVVQAIREKRPEFDIKIDSINARGLAPCIKFTVQHEKHKEPALEEVRKGYEIKLKQLECERDRYWELIKAAFDKPREVKLISAGPGAIVATDGSTVNIQQHIHNAIELQNAIAKEPAESKSFAKVAKKTALDIVGEAVKDIAKGQIKEAAKQIIELGKDLGPIIVKTAAYAFFRSLM